MIVPLLLLIQYVAEPAPSRARKDAAALPQPAGST